MRRHRFDPLSFVFGLLFSFLGVFVLVGNSLGDMSPMWAWTIPGVAIGLLVVLYSARRLIPERAVAPHAEPFEPTEDDPSQSSS